MTFLEALQAMQEGKWVRRMSDKTIAWCIENEQYHEVELINDVMIQLHRLSNESLPFFIEDFKAIDWQCFDPVVH